MEGHNFFALVGLLLPTFVGLCLWIALHKIFRFLLAPERCIGNLMRHYLRAQNYTAHIMRFILESCIDLLISSVICISLQNSPEVTLDENQLASLCVSYLTAFALFCAPLYLLWTGFLLNREAKSTKEDELPYEEIFSDLIPKSIKSLYFNVIFLMRRYAIVAVCLLSTDTVSSDKIMWI